MLYPLPNQVGAYGSLEAFSRIRPEDGQWVFWEDRVALIMQGHYDAVRPLHVELSPTYLCNFACPWCSCRKAREEWSDIDIFNRPDASDGTVAPPARLNAIIDNLAAARIDIQWVGGEPTMHPAFYDAAGRAAAAGLKQCIFTNGSLLHPKRAAALFDANFVFIRVSLDAVSPDVHRQHHDYAEHRNYGERTLNNLTELIAMKRARPGCRTLIGLSFVVDDVNIEDMTQSVALVEQLCAGFGHGAIDYIIVRPAYAFLGSRTELSPATADRLRAEFAPGAPMRSRLDEIGVKTIAPPGSFAGAEDRSDLGDADDRCLSCGWFSEIAPNGEMTICSDRYGAPEFTIGNAERETVDEIWIGERRNAVLSRVETGKCLKTYCPANGRGRHLNRIFHQIEGYRRRGEIDVVRDWIASLKQVLPRPEHSFFL